MGNAKKNKETESLQSYILSIMRQGRKNKVKYRNHVENYAKVVRDAFKERGLITTNYFKLIKNSIVITFKILNTKPELEVDEFFYVIIPKGKQSKKKEADLKKDLKEKYLNYRLGELEEYLVTPEMTEVKDKSSLKDFPHPGGIIREKILKPYKLSESKAAKILNVGRNTLNYFLKGETDLSKEMAYKIEIAFPEVGLKMEELMDIQTKYDKARFKKHPEKFNITPYPDFTP